MLEFDVAKKEYYSVAPSTDYSEAPHGDLPSDSDEVKLKCHIAQMSMIPLFLVLYKKTIFTECMRNF